ncbi:IclR family transcriptional regulator [Cupriavidus oxalaticus]|nr:IclR family transcriptional regulator [Cupriavidus oxalaticus]QRQ96047.1 IclR family transcriptional regulator [Cupriavidus oxalaticus]
MRTPSSPTIAPEKRRGATHAVLREPNDRQFASTLERGLRVLQCFSVDFPEMGNAELARRTGLPRPTVSRLTHTLIKLGYLRRNPETGEFGLGTSVLCLGYPLLAGLQLRQLSIGPMKELADAIDGSVTISVRDRLKMVQIESVTTRDVLKRKPGAGLTLPLLDSTVGAGWLVGASAEERKRATRELEHEEPGSWSGRKGEFEEFRRYFMRHGYVLRRNLLRAHTTALAAPLPRGQGAELLVLSCVLSISHGDQEALEASAGRQLLAAARQIGDRLLDK